ncbi:MAG TPA: replication-relaxation family protein [Dehalococcoidia bacterium]|nr:replication-relaxation family protein [Dehalococcoidia bacterium]
MKQVIIIKEDAPATRLPRYRRAGSPPRMRLTDRDVKVVHWVQEMRFLTREQIQRLEFSPASVSYCKRRLSLLFHNGYVERRFIPTPDSFGSTRAVYCLAARGAQLLRQELKLHPNQLEWRPKDRQRELYFLQHTLAINDFRICAILAAKFRNFTLDWVDERTLRRREMRDYVIDPRDKSQKLAIVPDGYFTLASDSGVSAFALELDRGTVEEKSFKTKVRAYGEWKQTGVYEQRYGTKSLRVLFVVEPNKRDPHRLARIKRWCEAEGGRSLFWFASNDHVSEISIFDEPVWQVAGREGEFSLVAGG